ncbi:MAG: HVO_0476 family zinc finger protein [Archaeoglobaceae archaeon]
MEIYCDTCKEVTKHEFVKEGLYRCSLCGTHSQITSKKNLEIKAIFSTGSETEIGKIVVGEDEEMAKDVEMIVDLESGNKIGRITAIQLKDGRIVEFSKAKDAYAVWFRNVGEVYVKFSLHKRSVTTSYKALFDGETEFIVGETIEVEKKRFRIHRIKLLDGKVLRREGERALAKDIKRIYATYTP